MRRLFNEKYLAMTPEAGSICRVMANEVMGIIRANPEVDLRDLEHILTNEVSLCCSTAVLLRAMEMRKTDE